MKNEIGRKITSLTIMAIMFAGLGLVQGIPSFMPGATADFSITEGELSVSSEFIQGAAILEIVVILLLSCGLVTGVQFTWNVVNDFLPRLEINVK